MAIHNISVKNHPAPTPKVHYQANPPAKAIGNAGGDKVKWDLAGAPVNALLLWFPDAHKVFDPPAGGFSFPVLVGFGRPFELTIKQGLAAGTSYKYVMYEPVSGEFIQGNSEPQVDV